MDEAGNYVTSAASVEPFKLNETVQVPGSIGTLKLHDSPTSALRFVVVVVRSRTPPLQDSVESGRGSDSLALPFASALRASVTIDENEPSVCAADSNCENEA